MTEEEIKTFAENHKVGFCLKPKGIRQLPSLSATKEFFAPNRVDHMAYLTPTEDQRNKPWCAAYACSSWAEGIMWQRNDTYDEIDPKWIYEWAKMHDGSPNTDGTTLTAVLEALRGSLFEKDQTRVRVISGSRLNYKYALHRYGMILCGFNITKKWYGCNFDNDVIDDSEKELLGGHAVCVAGYDKDYVYGLNSWGSEWGWYGQFKMTWAAFDQQVIYGAVLAGCFNGMDLI